LSHFDFSDVARNTPIFADFQKSVEVSREAAALSLLSKQRIPDGEENKDTAAGDLEEVPAADL
jgi:hypothetical protein